MKLLVTLLVTGLFAHAAVADVAPGSPEGKLNEAKTLFADRADGAKLDACLAAAAVAEAQGNDDVKYQALVLASKALYFKGVHTTGDKAKIALFEQGKAKAETAKKAKPDLADANFWFGANLSRWAEVKGAIASLSHKDELMASMEKVLDPDAKAFDGTAGEDYEYRGADRILGRVYFKLPGFAGGSRDKSLEHLSVAYDKAKADSLNVNYYAETLYAGPQADKAKARQILDEMLKQDPKTYNPARLPETAEEFADAKKLRAQMGK